MLGGGFAGLAWLAGGGLLGSALTWLAVVNVLLGSVNLLRGAPLYGGRLQRALLWRRYQDRARRRHRRPGRVRAGIHLYCAGRA